ncbi:hypothetical protein Lal_00041602 [Lupinus albus]|nr:hypothetical protein Lal_00041602 [Lupinus albus]
MPSSKGVVTGSARCRRERCHSFLDTELINDFRLKGARELVRKWIKLSGGVYIHHSIGRRIETLLFTIKNLNNSLERKPVTHYDSLHSVYMERCVAGVNPRRMATWQNIIEMLAMRLVSWKCRHISFGSRLVLLNSVLSNIPSYLLSLYKAPKKVVAKLASLQRKFLWGNRKGGKGIAWVSWSEMCKPKSLRGLGVRDLFCSNDSLLGKWRWRSIQENEAFVEIEIKLVKIS